MFYLVPVPKQFVDFSGVPYSGGSVTVYVHGTTDKANIYAEAGSSVLLHNPCQLDSDGSWKCFVPADTPLDYIVQDRDGNVVASYMNIVMPMIDTAVTKGYVDAQDQLRDRNFALDYNSDQAYPIVGTYVMNEGRLYKSAVVIDEPEEWNAEHWTECNITDELDAKIAAESQSRSSADSTLAGAISAETSRATAAEASARTEVVQGENCTVDRTTAADGHDVYTVNADGKPQVQSDWNQADSSKVDYIKNKPANLVQDANYVHTDNNYTTTEKNKLAGVESGAQVNVIEKVKVNGTEQGVTDKAVNISVPTASTATPLKDGTASAGSSTQWARGDHRHPTDDSREAVSNKKQVVNDSSTTEYPSSKAVADFVNSSVATNTANFLGTISESSLGLDYTATNAQIALALNEHSWESTPTNNDYCFVSVNNPQTTDVDEYRRFKFNGSVWAYEYTLNNSSFTQAQWDAINSGLTSSDRTAYNAAVTLLNSHVADTSIHVTTAEKNAWNAKQNAVSTDTDSSAFGDNTAIATGFSDDKLHLNIASRLWTYIQGKISSVLGLTSSSYGGKAATAGASDTASAATSGSALEAAINAKYTKPDGGIPKTDLASAVQTSLGKADSAIQGVKLNGSTLTPSSAKVVDLGNLKTKQTAKSDPTASGTGLEFIASASQDANGEIAVTKKTVQDGTTSQKGAVQLEDSVSSTSTTKAATSNSVKTAYDLAASKYTKPASGISKSDLASAVQTSLGLADTALQSADITNKLDKTGDGSNVTSTFTKNASDTSGMTSGGKLSAIFTAISSFFASLKALAFKDKVGTGEIADDAITAAKVKDNETLPVNVSGNAATADAALPRKYTINGEADGYYKVGTLSYNQPERFGGVLLLVTTRDYTDFNNQFLLYLQNGRYGSSPTPEAKAIQLAARVPNSSRKDGIDFYYKVNDDDSTDLYAKVLGNNFITITLLNDFKSCFTLSSTITTKVTLPDGAVEFTYERFVRGSFVDNTTIGSTTTPTYVDANGQVQSCTPSSMCVGWASNVNLSKTANAVNGDSIQAGTGASVTIGNAGNAKTWDSWKIAVDEFGTATDTIYFY